MRRDGLLLAGLRPYNTIVRFSPWQYKCKPRAETKIMTLFLTALIVLIVGYLTYGWLVERIFGADHKRDTCAHTMNDGIDYMPMPAWRVFLIQFLNIAGLGPIFGAIMGVMYGPAAFIWIVVGTIFGGAVHDYLSGMISLRRGGTSLPEIVGEELGKTIKQVMRVFSVVLMILVGAVFVLNPAELLSGMTVDYLNTTFWIIIVFAYYLLATLLPIDKLIGNIYPLFGAALLFMALGLMYVMLFGEVTIPAALTDSYANRSTSPEDTPIFPMMFVSIACGAISGFHATQCPMMARCLKNERLGRPIFYGAMVAEGIVALIWAAAAITYTGGYDGLSTFMSEHNSSPAVLVNSLCQDWLGTAGGILALLGVIAAPITSGDTALRSARLIVADSLGIQQRSIGKRLLVTIPIFALAFAVMMIDFNILWRYFGWCNQTLAVFTLWACTLWLARSGKAYIIALIPAMFMTTVCVTFILFSPIGAGLSLRVSTWLGIIATALVTGLFFRWKARWKAERK